MKDLIYDMLTAVQYICFLNYREIITGSYHHANGPESLHRAALHAERERERETTFNVVSFK